MKMDTAEFMDVIKNPLLAINEKFDQSNKNINDFMVEALQFCENVEKKLLGKESLKTLSVKSSDIQFPTLLGKGLQLQKQAKCSIMSVSSILTDRESGINIMEETIATRTRGALKARESKTTLRVSTHIKYETRTRGRHNKNTISDNSVNTHKRSAENEIQEKDCFKKKKLVSTKNENDSKVFKKPKTRGKGKAVKNQETESVKSLDYSTLEESQFFNAPVFFTSSPKINRASPRTSTAVLSPKQSTERINQSPTNIKAQRRSKKSLNEDVLAPSPMPISNDFINEDKNTESDKNIPTVESNISNIVSKLEKTLPRNSNGDTKRTGSSNTPKSAPVRDNESFVKNQSVEDNVETDLRKSNTPESKILRSEISSSTKTELNDTPKSNATVVLEKSEKESRQVPSFKSDEKSVKSVRATRSRTSRRKVTQKKDSSDLMPSPSEKHLSPAVIQSLDTTKSIREASKRTKPVLKSKIFDDKGNIRPNEPENDPTKKETAEKTYCLRSSPKTHSLNSPAVKENNEEAIKKKNSQNERSKRTRGKDTKKIKEVIDLPTDTGRVTRTKTKKAKEEQENAGRKSGLSLLARKSLNKAKIISLKKERLKAVQTLASRLTNQKGQNQMSSFKVYSHSKNQGSMQIVPCLKSTENLINSGKGKYLPLYNDRTNALITPAKRCETGDLLIKSAAKNVKENDTDKELKLKALKEKEEEAWVKREMAIKNRQKELKEKNEMKLQSAMKQRQKLETEKHNNILQSEKEKEAKSKLLLQEIELKRKEDVRKKKMEAEKKQAEAEERKRLKEEARKAKEKEQEAERQRILMGKEKEMERHQKWAQERLADEQAREKYEIKLKEQLMKAKALSSKKPDKSETTVTVWNYKPRNDNDFGLEDEFSENDSNDEEPAPSNRPIPKWAKRVLGKKCPTINFISQEMMAEYMTCHSKTPDIHKMFKMTPRKKIKRTSSAIWNTPSS